VAAGACRTPVATILRCACLALVSHIFCLVFR
jgi:hypothetical protein